MFMLLNWNRRRHWEIFACIVWLPVILLAPRKTWKSCRAKASGYMMYPPIRNMSISVFGMTMLILQLTEWSNLTVQVSFRGQELSKTRVLLSAPLMYYGGP